MQYAILVKTDDSVEIYEYTDWHTIQKMVDGFFEICGMFVAFDQKWLVHCNEEFLLRDELQLNATASLICGSPIYGDVAVLLDGYNDENERDSVPFDKETADKMKALLTHMQYTFAPDIEMIREKYSHSKPEPSAQIISFSVPENE